VVPAAAPREALGLERVDDGLRDLVLPDERAAAVLLPLPVVALRHDDIDGDAVGVRAEAVGVGDGPPLERAAERSRQVRVQRGRLPDEVDRDEPLLHGGRDSTERRLEERVTPDATGTKAAAPALMRLA